MPGADSLTGSVTSWKIPHLDKTLMNKAYSHEIFVDSLIQINPKTKNQIFACCIVVVTEVNSWGIRGYVQLRGENNHIGRCTYVNVPWEEMQPVGTAHWVNVLCHPKKD